MTRVRLEADRLDFAPEVGETGSPYAAFAFTVSDGSADSAPATMSVHVVGRGAKRAAGAWVSRFRRMAADQVLDAVERRMRAARRSQAAVSLGGERIGPGRSSRDRPADPPRPRPPHRTLLTGRRRLVISTVASQARRGETWPRGAGWFLHAAVLRTAPVQMTLCLPFAEDRVRGSPRSDGVAGGLSFDMIGIHRFM
ncbi:MAG: hypothetical protein OXP07_18375 [Defluviicoccus sp.]|nr:hypothetical protein [Defluviicoccus sp.]